MQSYVKVKSGTVLPSKTLILVLKFCIDPGASIFIENLVKNINFGQKSKFWSKIEIFVKNKNFVQNKNFGQK